MIYPSPGYPLFESFIRYIGGVPIPLRLREDTGFNFTGEDLGKLITPRTKMIFLNFPSNPTGGVASRDQLTEIASVILARTGPEVRVYSDEAYEAIVFDGAEHVSIASIPGMAERTIIASGASKTYSWTGGRIGWGVFPTVVEAKVQRRLNINYFASIPPYNQLGVKVALESPESAPAIALMVEAFPAASRPGGRRAQRHRGHYVPEPAWCVLCLSQRHRGALASRWLRPLRSAASRGEGSFFASNAAPVVPALPVSGGDDGPALIRGARFGGRELPAHLDCHGRRRSHRGDAPFRGRS